MLPDAFKRLKPLYGVRIDRLWIEYQLADPERRKEIDELLTILSVRRLGIAIGDERIVLEPPQLGIIGLGEYTLGMVEYPGMTPYPFCISRKEVQRHIFLLGPSGTGKSTFILGLLQQLLHDGVPIAVFDFKKNYRPLLIATPSLLVITVGRETAPLGVNALQAPQGVTSGEWIEALTDIIATSYLLMQGARNVLKEALTIAVQEHGRDARLHDALGLIRSALATARSGSRRYGWLESTCRSLEELTTGQFGSGLNATEALPLTEVLAQPVVFEVHGLGDDQKRFFCLYVLQYLLLLRKNAPAAREVLRHVLVFDESQHVFPKDQYGTLSIPSRLAREIREYGEGIIAATQQADVAESLIANSGIKIILRCDFPRDVEFASKLLQIEPRWIPKIPLGFGIARLPTRYYQPFLFTFPQQPLKNTIVPDAAVKERYTQIMQGPAPPAAAIAQQPRPATAEAQRDTRPTGSMPAITADQLALLCDIATDPVSTVTQRYQRLGWSRKIGGRIKDLIVRQGWATVLTIPAPPGRVTLLALTPAGEVTVNHAGITVRRAGRASVEHEYWRQFLTARLTQHGYTVADELVLRDGGRVDLCAERGERRLLIEIETGKSNMLANIAKSQGEPGVHVVFCTRSTVRQRLHRLLPPHVVCLCPNTSTRLASLLE